MAEGSLEAPIRHPLDWQSDDFYNEESLLTEMERIFDICHGCRRCFNLCDSFPILFDMVDDSPSGELDTVDKKEYKKVVDACTLCDMCFLTKCPYVPPHEFNLDFPHLMLRARAVEAKKQGTGFFEKQLRETDRNGKLGCGMHGLANWATSRENGLTRGLMESIAGVDKNADLPTYAPKTLLDELKSGAPTRAEQAPAKERKAVLYATCFGNYNDPDIGMDAVKVLTKNGVQVETLYPGCCGMPQLETGDIARVAEQAKTVAAAFKPYIEKGYDIVGLVPSCTLMLKFEWPLILPDNEDVKLLSGATKDISEYIVDISKKEGLAEGLTPLDGGVTVHIACHARAQNVGQKAAELLRLIPDTDIKVIERCSGHGGAWGVEKGNFETAIKVGKPVARQASKNATPYVVSECPLGQTHILQGMDMLGERPGDAAPIDKAAKHPIQLLARSYGL